MKEYDIVIIGGGISGLYTALNFKKLYPKKTFLIIERNRKLGGRMNKYNFFGVNVNIGAGVGRKAKDAILINLLDELGVGYKEFISETAYSKTIGCILDLKPTIRFLKQKYVDNIHRGLTFKKYAISILGHEDYLCFVMRMGFSDFEAESAYDVINYYGLEDNLGGWTGLSIDWALLIHKIHHRVGIEHIHMNEAVVNLDLNNKDGDITVFTNKRHYNAKQIVIASTVDTVRFLLPECGIYRRIQGQSFLKLYGKFGVDIPSIDSSVVVPGPIKKITPIDKSKGVYMIAYTDNAGADFINQYSQNNISNRKFLSDLILKSLGLDPNIDLKLTAIKAFYWTIGTHYYTPLHKKYANRKDFLNDAQRPYENVFVVGEMVSLHQGWSLGALESVKSILNEL